jgi:biopolymer transport protein ExbB/TolQ
MEKGNKMSIGNIFVESEKPEPLKRIENLEQQLPFMIAKVQSYDKAVDDMKEFKKYTSFINEQLAAISVRLEEFVSNSKSQDIKIQSYLELMKNVVAPIAQNLEKSKKDISDLSQSHDDLEKILDQSDSNHNLRFINFTKNYVSLDDVNSILSELDHNHHLHDLFLDKNANDISNLESNMPDLEELKTQIRNEFMSFLDKSLKNQITVFEEKINSLKSAIDTSPATILAVKNDISNQLDSAKLDASNAVIRSNNSAQQIVILEKKIENIYLLLKKHELNA